MTETTDHQKILITTLEELVNKRTQETLEAYFEKNKWKSLYESLKEKYDILASEKANTEKPDTKK